MDSWVIKHVISKYVTSFTQLRASNHHRIEQHATKDLLLRIYISPAPSSTMIYRWLIALSAFGIASSRPQFPSVNSQLELIMATTTNADGYVGGSGSSGGASGVTPLRIPHHHHHDQRGNQFRYGPVITPAISPVVQSIRIPDETVISPPGLVTAQMAAILVVNPPFPIPIFYN